MRLKSFIYLPLCLGLWACSSAEKHDLNTPEGAYKSAEDLEKDERWEEAIQRYSDVKNKHPYSRFAVMAELKIGDVHFLREAFVEAQNAYQLFKDFHTKHAQIDYVTFRLGLSYFKQLPPTIDRDLSLAEKAILYFDEVINSYPQSQYVKEARDRRGEALHMLAEKELYVARFYVKKKQYDSALKRFEYLLKTYSNQGFDPAALYGASRSAFETGDRDRGFQHLSRLYKDFPNSDEAHRARNEFAKYGTN